MKGQQDLEMTGGRPHGPMEPEVGTQQKCVGCGKPYTVRHAYDFMCPKCAWGDDEETHFES